MTDKLGIPSACLEAISGQHNDLFEIEKNVGKILATLVDANISYKGLFLNADAGFDSHNLRSLLSQYATHANIDNNKRNKKEDTEYGYLLDDELYRERFVIERTNAWIDGLKICSLGMRQMPSTGWDYIILPLQSSAYEKSII